MLSKQFIDDVINVGNTNIKPGLERMYAILELLSNPQQQYKVIHITGTNGKGSTAAFLETGLIHAKYTVGKFTSPYIHVINECIVLNNEQISDSELQQTYLKIKNLLNEHKLDLSPFEFLTTIMFEYFANKKIEWLILEVGMGGANDSTNVVNSLYSIITNISLEHTQYLGDNLSKIAIEKAGIIKNGLTIIASNNTELIDAVSSKTSNYINILDKYPVKISLDTEQFKTIIKLPNVDYSLSLFGKFQAYNFLCAYAVFQAIGLSPHIIQYAAENTQWTGRLQLFQRNPVVLLDATHNVGGSESLQDSLCGIYNKDDVIIITSILKDKDIKAMLANFSLLSNSIICTSIKNNPRGMEANEIAEYAKNIVPNVYSIDDPLVALIKAKEQHKKLILITGSLYLLSYFTP